MSIVLAGGAGFIGCALVRHFLASGHRVLVLDNLCRGRREFLENMPAEDRLQFVEMDIADVPRTIDVLGAFHGRHPVGVVWHMAANSDIPGGIADANVDLRDTFMTTFALLEAMKCHGLRKMAFASTSAIYGDHGSKTPLHEDVGPLLPISNYGAMKLASEAAISAAVESHLEQAWIFRFPNVVGVPATHGVILDFVRKLKATPGQLQVLGNGTQQKVYLHVSELVEAMLFIVDHARERINYFNIGPEDSGVNVATIAQDVVAQVSPGATIQYGTEGRGWVGDVPKFTYCIDKLARLGWRPRYSSREAVQRAVAEIAIQEGL